VCEDKTKEINGPRSFEERVFARFDALEGRVDRMEVRFEQRFASVDDGLDSVGQHPCGSAACPPSFGQARITKHLGSGPSVLRKLSAARSA